MKNQPTAFLAGLDFQPTAFLAGLDFQPTAFLAGLDFQPRRFLPEFVGKSSSVRIGCGWKVLYGQITA